MEQVRKKRKVYSRRQNRSAASCASTNTGQRRHSLNESRNPRAKTRKRKHQTGPITLSDIDVIDHWTRVREEKKFSADVDVARFLLSWYLDGGGAASNSCGKCGRPLVSYCQACKRSNVTSTSLSQPPANKKTPHAAPQDAGNIKQEETLETLVASEHLRHEFTKDYPDLVKVQFEVESSAEGKQSWSVNLDENLQRGQPAVSETQTDLASSDEVHDVDGGDAGSNESVSSDDDDVDKIKDGTDEPNSGKRKTGQASADHLCPFCPEAFPVWTGSGPKRYRKHMRAHADLIAITDNDKYRCAACPRTFSRLSDLVVHVGIYVGENVCSVCQGSVNFRCELLKHKRRHARERKQFCKWCQETKVELTQTAFLQHVREHKANEPITDEPKEAKEPSKSYMCAKCGNCYTKPVYLSTHMIRAHTDERSFVCDWPGCRSSFKIQRDLFIHKLCHGDKQEVCEQCGKKFNRPLDLELHMQDHVGRKLQCELCPKRFKTTAKLTEHVNAVHKGIRRFACSLCEKRFATKSTLAQHTTNIHTNSQSFPCQQCGQALKSKRALEKHLLRHSNLKPFKCQDCEMAFRDSSTFSAHRKAKHKDRVYVCKMCAATFPIPQSLAFHMKMCHNEVTFDVDKVLPVSVYEVERMNESEAAAASLSRSLEEADCMP